MTECPEGEMRDLLPDLLHGQLAPARRARVEAHVAGCAECRAELALLVRLRRTLEHVPAVGVASIAALLPAYRAPAPRRMVGWRAAASIAAVAIGGASVAVARHDTGMQRATVVPTPSAQSALLIPSRVVGAVPGARQAPAIAQHADRSHDRELAVTGVVSDLNDRELATLLHGIGSLQAVPSADVESGASLAPVPDMSRAREER